MGAGTGWIISAWYGAPVAGGSAPVTSPLGAAGFFDVTPYVAQQFASANGQAVTITANNATFGDPNVGLLKSLTIVYAYAYATPQVSTSSGATQPPSTGVYNLGSFQTVTQNCVENGTITIPAAWSAA